MAKKKKKKKSPKKKASTKASYTPAEIRAYHAEHGWKDTMAHFKIAPKDLSPIVKGKKAKKGTKKKKKPPTNKKGRGAKKATKTTKGKKKTAKKSKSAAAPYGYKKDGTPKKPPGRKTGKRKTSKKKTAKRGKSADAPYGYKKDGTPRKPPGRKTGKRKSKAAAPKSAKAPKRQTKRKASGAQVRNFEMEGVLDWLLEYRGKNQKQGHMVPLDSVIIDITAELRAA